MACILHIETSGVACSVALSENGAVIYEKTELKGPSHAALLGGFVEGAVSFADSHAIPLDAVALSAGPGSYTGLRIGASMAKGLCYGRGLKLLALPTLKVMAVPVLLRHDDLPPNALLAPLIDARRMEVYTALYNRALQPVVDVRAEVMTPESFKAEAEGRPLYLFGSGAEKCKALLSERKDVHFIDGVLPLAKNMMPLAERAYVQGRFEDVAYFEPFYLKAFVAGKPKNLL